MGPGNAWRRLAGLTPAPAASKPAPHSVPRGNNRVDKGRAAGREIKREGQSLPNRAPYASFAPCGLWKTLRAQSRPVVPTIEAGPRVSHSPNPDATLLREKMFH